jgi:hypothetical protein
MDGNVVEWNGFELGRAVLVLAAILFVCIWLQVTLLHWAGGFRHWAMWGPVLATPGFAAVALVGVVTRTGAFGWVVAGVMVVAVLEGLLGVGYHLLGIRAQIGGFSLRNVMSGPPPLLPLAYALIGLLGLAGVMWDG